MTQVFEKTYQYTKSAVTVPATGLTTIATINTMGRKLLNFAFSVATQALDDFDVKGKEHPDGPQFDYTPAGGWTAPDEGDRIVEASGDLAAVAAGADGKFAMDVSGLYEVEILASAAVDSASVTPFWSLQ